MKHVIGRASATIAAATLGLVAAAPAALAISGPLSNGSFEDLPAGADYATVTTANQATYLTPWVVHDGDLDLVRDTYWQAADGHQSLDLAGTTSGSVLQTIGTTVGHTYLISFAYTANPDGGPVQKKLKLSVTGGAALSLFPTTTGVTRANMLWKNASLSFTADRAAVNIVFADVDNPVTTYGPVIDAVTVTDVTANPVLPDAKTPAVLALAGLVVAGGVVVGRRRA